MEFVKYEQKGFVGIMTINRPKAMNALNAQVLDEMAETIDNILIDETRWLIITGGGEKAFVAGADIAMMREMTHEEGKEWSRKGNSVFRSLTTLPIPVIAAVNGYALGGGCELASACDIRIASHNAVFSQPEVSLGITAGFGGTQRLARIVGFGWAKEMLYTAGRIDANTALQIGLVNHVYPQESLMEEAVKLAERIAANAPIAVRATKMAVNRGQDVGNQWSLEVESDQFSTCFESEDQHNAMLAFLEKRKPGAFLNR